MDEIEAVKAKQNFLRERLAARRQQREKILAGVVPAGFSSSALQSSLKAFPNVGLTGIKPVAKSLSKTTVVAVPCKKSTDPVEVVTNKSSTSSSSESTVDVSDQASVKPTIQETISDATTTEVIPSTNLKSTTSPSKSNLLKRVHSENGLSTSTIATTVSSSSNMASTPPTCIQPSTTERPTTTLLSPTMLPPDCSQPNTVQSLTTTMTDVVSQPPVPSKTRRSAEGGLPTRYDELEDLLGAQTALEKESKRVQEEILELLNTPTAKERYLNERFRSQGGSQVQQFCVQGTHVECGKHKMKTGDRDKCRKLHFRKIVHPHTDESLGDCSFLNTCFHMDTCKWVNCDIRQLSMSVLGKFAVIMADPPWDIHMELPYGTMSDDEMRRMDIPCLQDDGYIFLWVTGRAMELGRDCLRLWGYQRVDEIIWVKTNQLQRLIRTGRTGHWLNHGKEHCLVGVKGKPQRVNRGLDCDVIVSEVRETSHKPDEIYGIIERLSPGTRKLELFGRPHNLQPNWLTLGNQLDGTCLVDPVVVERFRKYFPKGLNKN